MLMRTFHASGQCKTSIYTPSDNQTTKLIAKNIYKTKFSYVRLDRDAQKDLNPKINNQDYKNGFKIFGKIEKNKIAILTRKNIS